MTVDRTDRPGLTLRRMMKLVVFAAAGSVCLAPMVRLAGEGAVGWPFALLLEGMAVPLVLGLVAFPLIRPGPGKDRAIRGLLLTSVGVGFAAAVYTLAWAPYGPPALNAWAGTGMTRGVVWGFVVALGIPFVLLARRVAMGR